MLHQASTKVVVVAFQSRILPTRSFAIHHYGHHFSKLHIITYCYNNTTAYISRHHCRCPNSTGYRQLFNLQNIYTYNYRIYAKKILHLLYYLSLKYQNPFFFPFYISYISFIYIPTEHGDHASLCIALAIKAI